jgi:hypothetical protein
MMIVAPAINTRFMATDKRTIRNGDSSTRRFDRTIHPSDHVITLAILMIACRASLASAAPLERRLHSDRVEASTYVWSERIAHDENYHPNFVADDNPATAWIESSGAGEWLRLHLTNLKDTTRVRLRIRNGCQKSKDLWQANARAKQVTLRLLPSKAEKRVALTDTEGWQDVAIDQPSGMLEAVELAIGSVYEGARSKDLCISDVQVHATSAAAEDPFRESSNRDGLISWRDARRATASAFASAKTLPLYPAYVTTTVTTRVGGGWAGHELIAVATKDPAFAKEWKEALAAAATATGRVHRVRLTLANRTPIPAIDGFEIPTMHRMLTDGFALDSTAIRMPMEGVIEMLFADRLHAVDVEDNQTVRQFKAAKGRCARDVHWVSRGPSAKIETLVIGRCQELPNRTGSWNAHSTELLVYNASGLLVLAVTEGSLEGYRWTTDGDRPMLVGGRSLLGDGYVIEATRRKAR